MSAEIKTMIARKEHRCDSCGRLIPVGDRYWRKFSDSEDFREHTNCEAYAKAEELPLGFNQNRSIRK